MDLLQPTVSDLCEKPLPGETLPFECEFRMPAPQHVQCRDSKNKKTSRFQYATKLFQGLCFRSRRKVNQNIQ